MIGLFKKQIILSYNFIFNKDMTHIAIIPTLMIQMTPEIEPLIRKYEKLYQIHYIVAIRDKGLILKSINTVMQEMKENN